MATEYNVIYFVFQYFFSFKYSKQIKFINNFINCSLPIKDITRIKRTGIKYSILGGKKTKGKTLLSMFIEQIYYMHFKKKNQKQP